MIFSAAISKTLQDRILEKVEILTECGCWIWDGKEHPTGYGRTSVLNETLLAHRVSYCAFKGAIKNGLHVLHRCDVRLCVNPDHLFLGYPQDNVDDMISKGRCSYIRGSTVWNSKISESEVSEIRDLVRIFSQREVGILYGISQPSVSDIIRGATWLHA